ncbi:hypothetical protein UPYG_G00025740 [Umbra pygmaea]|uniref:Peptidase M12B domain-containing protein n=1 Tax=Umbra pygmaea TaxID=75934 RepID=A0ABD0Y8Y8_UMBPY
MSFLRVSLGLITALCVSAAHGTWEESTVVPVRLDPVQHEGEMERGRTLSVEERKKESEMRIYRLDIFGKRVVLQLEPDQTFLAPGFVFHVVGSPESQAQRESDNSAADDRCFFSGTVNREEDSAVALNLCHGLRGGFYFQGEEYIIYPHNASYVQPTDEDVHLIRRRGRESVAEDSSTKCGVNEDEDRVPENQEKNEKHGHTNSDQTGHHQRSKRFVSTPRFVEIMIVADQSMAEFHGAGLKPYLLTIMAVASRLYRHPTIHNSISLAVVKLLVVYEEESGPQVSSNAALTLRNFCQWQQQHNPPSDRHPEHFDTAVLFTRTDLCGAHTCDTLGMADVGTVCDPERSCSIVEDDGLQAAFTVAHELGHVFNMPHDDSRQCVSVNGDQWGSHMMASTLSNLNQLQPWSPCSALMVTSFLDNGHGQCLLDRPQKPQPLPAALPGSVYDANRQCRLTFGEESQHCPDLSTLCAALWCTVTTTNGLLVCQTKNFPWADGTPCWWGQLLHGRTVSQQDRGCSSPDSSQWRLGNMGTMGGLLTDLRRRQTCPDSNGLSFREEQCLAHNDFSSQVSFGLDVVEWVPKYAGVSPKDRCKLTCRAKGTGYFFILKPKVADGTPCSPDSTSVCVQGQCVKAGCDRVIGSSLQFDKCGVCGGDDSTCKKVSGALERARPGYQDVVTIPAGATHLDVKQRALGSGRNDNSYLAVRRKDGTYLLNGDYKLTTLKTDIALKGGLLRYSGSSASLERLRSFSPLPEALTIQVLSVGDSPRPRVKYSYFAPRPNSTPSSGGTMARRQSINAIREFGVAEWTLREWGPCSQSCGGGTQQREVVCLDPKGRQSRKCPHKLRPSTSRSCALNACPSWFLGEWSACSKSCGLGYRKRPLRCVGHDGRTLAHENCEQNDRPRPLLDLCNQRNC